MASNIQNWTIELYRKNVFYLSQQMGSKQRGTVMTQDINGRASYIEGIGTTDPQPIVTRHAITPNYEIDHLRRQLTLSDWHWGAMVDRIDTIRMLVDPAGKYTQSAMWGFGRLIDRMINANLLGPARSGMQGETIVSLPDSQKLGMSTYVPMSLEVLQAVAQKFDENNVPENMPKYFVIGTRQKQDLLATTKVTSADYNSVKALVNGQIDTFMGFKFITTTSLEKDSDNKRHCIAYTRPALTLGFGSNPRVRMAEDPGRSFNQRLYMEMSLGAVRVEEAQVVEAALWEDPSLDGGIIPFEATTPDVGAGLSRHIGSMQAGSIEAASTKPAATEINSSVINDLISKGVDSRLSKFEGSMNSKIDGLISTLTSSGTNDTIKDPNPKDVKKILGDKK